MEYSSSNILRWSNKRTWHGFERKRDTNFKIFKSIFFWLLVDSLSF